MFTSQWHLETQKVVFSYLIYQVTDGVICGAFAGAKVCAQFGFSYLIKKKKEGVNQCTKIEHRSHPSQGNILSTEMLT